MSKTFKACRRRLRSFTRNDRGSMAVEFSFLAPILIFMIFGTLELTDAIAAKRRVTMAVSTLADLVTNSRHDWVHSDDVEHVMDATAGVMKPYGIDNATLRLTCVEWDAGSGEQKVVWSIERSGDGAIYKPTAPGYNAGDKFTRLAGKDILLPNEELVRSGFHLIVGEISYPYEPPLGRYYGEFQIEQIEARLPRREEFVHYCETGAGCTDGRTWNATTGRPE